MKHLVDAFTIFFFLLGVGHLSVLPIKILFCESAKSEIKRWKVNSEVTLAVRSQCK